jgi:putative hydrolase of the HAD superfamily
MIKNVVFDMGGVLVRFDAHLFMQRAGIPLEYEDLVQREAIRSIEWARIDRGSMTDDEAVESICRRLPPELHDATRKLVTMDDRPIIPIAGMAELIGEVKAAGCGVYLLSNTGLHQRNFWPRIPGHEYFDGGLISAEWKLIKPQPEFYRALLETYHLSPEECLFVDDKAPNVEAACCCGLQGFVFHGDSQELRRRLQAEKVLPE